MVSGMPKVSILSTECGLNPSFGGILCRVAGDYGQRNEHVFVLILLLVEYGVGCKCLYSASQLQSLCRALEVADIIVSRQASGK